MPGTTLTALPSFSHDQHHETDAAKRKGEFVGKKKQISLHSQTNKHRDTQLYILVRSIGGILAQTTEQTDCLEASDRLFYLFICFDTMTAYK